jgi:predicted transcriptional regulator
MGVASPRKHIDSDVPAPRVTTFRVDRDVLNRLDIYAVRTRRSRNSAVNDLLMVALDQEDATRFDAPERH